MAKKETFKIGENVFLNNKTYKIIGTVKRSFLLERQGKQYKATAKMMKKIQVQNSNGIGNNARRKRTKRSATFHMDRRLAYRRIFSPDAKMPETEDELMAALGQLCGELSPENLSCDGEIPRSAMLKKASALRAEWKEIERKLGRKVSESEAERNWLLEYV